MPPSFLSVTIMRWITIKNKFGDFVSEAVEISGKGGKLRAELRSFAQAGPWFSSMGKISYAFPSL